MRPKAIYVAGSSREAALVAAYMDGLRAAGWIVTVDWPAAVAASPVPDHELPLEVQQAHARWDLAGVASAQVLWLVGPSTPSVGAYVELGFALARGVRVVASGPQSLFTSLAAERYATHAEAFAALTQVGAALGAERLAAR